MFIFPTSKLSPTQDCYSPSKRLANDFLSGRHWTQCIQIRDWYVQYVSFSFAFLHSWYVLFDEQFCLMVFVFAGLHEYPNFLCIMACDWGFNSLRYFNDENISKTSIWETSSHTSLLLQVIFRRKREMRSGTVLVNLCKCVSIKVDMTSSRELKIVGEGGERLRLSVLRLIYGSSVFGIPIWNISHYSVL